MPRPPAGMNASQRRRRSERRKSERESKRRSRTSKLLDIEGSFSPRSLLDASHECLRSVRWKASAQRWCIYGLANSTKLSRQIVSGSYSKRKTNTFYLTERGKRRLITPVAFRDRVVEHVLCEKVLIPLLGPELTHDNAASQKGKGTKFAMDRFRTAMAWCARRNEDAWILTFDYHDYFGSIPSSRAMEEIERRLVSSASTDEQLDNARRISDLTRAFVCESSGLGLGNQTSQVVAVWWATPIDTWLASVSMRSGRYMDDGWAIFRSRDEADASLAELRKRSASIGLTLSEGKTMTRRLVGSDVKFLKGVYRAHGSGKVTCRISSASLRRWRRHCRSVARLMGSGRISASDLESCLSSSRSIASRCDSASKRRLLRDMERFKVRIIG